MKDVLNCPHSHFCSGCDAITLPYADQKALKLAKLEQILGDPSIPIQFQSFGTHGLRSRLDFTLDHGKLGLFSHLTQKIEDLPSCLQLSPKLAEAYQAFRKILHPQIKGSFRLRSAPNGEIGIWLDFSNEHVKQLLQEKTYLTKLQSLGFVEIGQRHKALYSKPDGSLGIKAPEFRLWSESLLHQKVVPLLSTVASFTQPSHASNQWITQKISDWSRLLKAQKILEFGSGIGNLSFASLNSSLTQLTALEFDSLALQAFLRNAESFDVQNQIRTFRGDFRKTLLESSDFEFDLMLLNPARNGVGDLLKDSRLRPENIIYMSCYPESFAVDIQNLSNRGYSLKEIWIADQFPQTHHMEIISRWEMTD